MRPNGRGCRGGMATSVNSEAGMSALGQRFQVAVGRLLAESVQFKNSLYSRTIMTANLSELPTIALPEVLPIR
jgi:hypothetical protein